MGERVMKQKGQTMKPFRQIMMGVVILIIAGCTTQFRNQDIPTEEEIGALVVGVDTRDSVFEHWAHNLACCKRIRRITALGLNASARFKEVERQVLALAFDQDGVLTARDNIL